MDELIFRFLIGGTLVSAFALVGDAVRPNRKFPLTVAATSSEKQKENWATQLSTGFLTERLEE
jgi:hypothetical protein